MASLMNRFRILLCNMQNVIPKEYEKLDFITESGYVSVIDTGISGDDLDIELKFNHDTFVQWLAIFGNYVNTSTDAYRLLLGSNETQLYCLRGTQANSNRIIAPNGGVINNDIVIRFDASGYAAISNGVEVIGTPTSTHGNENTRNIGIGYSAVTTSKIARSGKTKYYYCKLRRNGTLLRNFIPCKRISDDKVGMYDLVTRAFFTSVTAYDFSEG